MIFKTKYDVGFTYWVPRVIKKYEKETIVVKGILYERDISVLHPIAKEKIIVGIKISVYKSGTSINYLVNNINNIGSFPYTVNSRNHERMFLTREEAFNFAIDKLNENKDVFYGEKLPESEREN